ncbi:MAG TPA: hypothetical protein VEG65_01920 [Candidatus Bathyarchaeia archaeon]|nr:hypothetical protein [Candidatus Bathyarchaeia archaeon]
MYDSLQSSQVATSILRHFVETVSQETGHKWNKKTLAGRLTSVTGLIGRSTIRRLEAFTRTARMALGT